MKIWSKIGEDIPKEVQEFLSGGDIVLDRHLIFWDALGSIAHAKTLARANVLSEGDAKKLVLGLKKAILLHKKGKFVLDESLEDVHSNIEAFLTSELGDLGKKLHTGRSRNDQVALDLLLYSKWELLLVCGQASYLASKLILLAKESDFPMPGYTHSRKAMVTSASHWLLAYAELLIDDLELSVAIIDSLDKSPLGAGASYGSIIPLDRAFSAKELNFSSLQLNTLAAVGSRNKKTQLALYALLSIMQTLSAFSSDLISLSGQGLVSLPKEYCTGSSIMPHKSNPDALELVRAKSAKMLGLLVSVAATANSLPLGYHRDLQETKGALVEGFGIAKSSLSIMGGIVLGLNVNEKECLGAISPEMSLADIATKMSLDGVPFRDAYKSAKLDSKYPELLNPKKNISLKTHAGAPGDKKMAGKLQMKLSALEKKIKWKKGAFVSAIKKLSDSTPE